MMGESYRPETSDSYTAEALYQFVDCLEAAANGWGESAWEDAAYFALVASSGLIGEGSS